MKRGTTPACRYCSTDEVLCSVRRVRRRFGRLLVIPDLALHELDRVARRIADVDGSPTARPRDLALDLDAVPSQSFRQTRQRPVRDPARRVPGAGRAVRRNEATGRTAWLRVEDQ